jgi:rhodanese-related sulfurtransferase
MSKQQAEKPRFRGTPVDLIVDVRTKVEYWMGHLPGAVCLPGELLPDALTGRPGISTSSRILVYCASGGRSAAAAEQLRAAGYTRVVDAGGLSTAREHFTP